MNLVLSGPADESLLAMVEQLSRPIRSVCTRQGVWRFEQVDDSTATRRAVAVHCDAAAVDHAYIGANVRFSDMKLLAIDMDSTLITIECIDEMADFAGKRSEVAAITEATMRGEITDFAESLRRRVALLEGLDVSVLQRVYEERLQLSPGAETLISAARANGMFLLLVSGGFTYFADRLRDLLSFDACFANVLETSRGRLTGRISNRVVDAPAKASRVQEAMNISCCRRDQAIVIGDGANDVQMMRRVDHSISYRGKTAANESASMTIKYGGLNTAISFMT